MAYNIYVDWNDFDALAEVFEENRDQIAAVIGQPYMHGNFMDNQMPEKDFWQKVRKLCDDTGTVLIIDDVRAGFRMDLAGSDHYFGFKADLICFCKALANGYNVSALCGQAHMKNVVSGLNVTGSYWLSAVPFAAGIACIQKLKRLHQAWVAECQKRGVYFTNHHNHFINAALSDEDIRETIEIAGEAFAALKER